MQHRIPILRGLVVGPIELRAIPAVTSDSCSPAFLPQSRPLCGASVSSCDSVRRALAASGSARVAHPSLRVGAHDLGTRRSSGARRDRAGLPRTPPVRGRRGRSCRGHVPGRRACRRPHLAAACPVRDSARRASAGRARGQRHRHRRACPRGRGVGFRGRRPGRSPRSRSAGGACRGHGAGRRACCRGARRARPRAGACRPGLGQSSGDRPVRCRRFRAARAAPAPPCNTSTATCAPPAT